MHRHICLYTYLDVFSKVKIGLMWASEQCYGEIMRSAQSLGLCVDNFTENLKQLKGYVRRRRRHVRLDDNLFQQKFVTVEDIKVPDPFSDSPCAEMVTRGKIGTNCSQDRCAAPDRFLTRLGIP